MRLSALSIERPVLATVATLLLMLFGILSYSRLPVREYPDITFPVVSVLTVYQSADAQLVETDITSVLEDGEDTHNAMYLGGATSFLQKPVDEKSILAELRRLGCLPAEAEA